MYNGLYNKGLLMWNNLILYNSNQHGGKPEEAMLMCTGQTAC